MAPFPVEAAKSEWSRGGSAGVGPTPPDSDRSTLDFTLYRGWVGVPPKSGCHRPIPLRIGRLRFESADFAVIEQLKLMGPVILSGVLKTLDGYSNTEADVASKDVKSFAFQAIGLLAHRMPQLFRDKIEMALRLFNALKVEDQSLRLTIQEATNSLAVAYKVNKGILTTLPEEDPEVNGTSPKRFIWVLLVCPVLDRNQNGRTKTTLPVECSLLYRSNVCKKQKVHVYNEGAATVSSKVSKGAALRL
ncbi:hypothetical protein Taro_010028 [Colocasia esculenta]|uniref:Proteasome component Ecm29 N-terminal domain-containing protein n=1 Tax=Colocasia esculenta TaxID=4460 RepID=A0A843U6I1_COLES|nr:hypothetical protein [Colocasia esculenta]